MRRWWQSITEESPELRDNPQFLRDKFHAQLVLGGICCMFLGAFFCAWLITSAQPESKGVELRTRATYQIGR